MNKIIKILLLIIFRTLPLTSFYKTKSKLLNILGMKVSMTARIVSSVQFLGPKNIKIGDDTFIGHETTITGSYNSNVTIGNYVDISNRVLLSTGTHEIDIKGKHIAGKGLSKDIVIKDGVWIGMGAVILPGVTIGEKSIVAAGAIVVNDVPEYSIVAGNPAKIKKIYNFETCEWKKYENV